MPIIENNKACCGCRACEEICPKDAISMIEDTETFIYPTINKSLCINCNLCEKVCPLNFKDFISYSDVRAYVGTYRSKEVIYESSSGGAFTAIYETLIDKGYIVYGVRYDENLKVIHDSARTFEECKSFRKSKYVQSNTNGCFEKIASDLKSGSKVLFSGVSCQCAALDSYLKTKRIDSDNLITVNLLCHGVPSQRMFDEYKKEEEEEEASMFFQFRFKNKMAQESLVNSRTAYAEFKNGHHYIRTIADDAFLRGYYKRLFYRPACAVCPFTRKERITDFTIADAWGIEKIYKEYNTLEGVSLLLLNTKKAFDNFDKIQEKMELREVSAEWALNSQGLFSKPTTMHPNRDKFFNLRRKVGFKKAVFKVVPITLKHRIASLMPYIIKQRIKQLM